MCLLLNLVLTVYFVFVFLSKSCVSDLGSQSLDICSNTVEQVNQSIYIL